MHIFGRKKKTLQEAAAGRQESASAGRKIPKGSAVSVGGDALRSACTAG